GYTDTVGPADGNIALSRARAKAIASWFAQNGFTYPIYFQGFGEQGLAVPTPDNTNEAANRRAAYIVAAEVPPTSRAIPSQTWKAL
ncbi:MAG TPA: OmpA family protein, partial [Deltaproteobacteria bacterium]|nr:OmpA family protein [Deltaproteobacteria bacterium]